MKDDQGSTLPPTALAETDGVPEPRDVAYPGTLRVRVDATDVERRIFRVRQTMPVSRTGKFMFLYPKWLPGFHAPQAPIELFAGLAVRIAGEPVTWIRHPTTVNAFHVDVPEGVDHLDLEFQFLSPTDPSQGRVSCTADLFCMPWNTVLLYPAGHYARQIMVEPELTIPPGWDFGCVLDQVARDGDTIRFAPTPLDVLVDSPVLAGRHFRRIRLDDNVHLNIAADQAHLIDITDAQIEPHRGVVTQSDRLFGARHFDRFEMLLAVSDDLSSAGAEHHRSFEAVTSADYFTNWNGSSFAVTPSRTNTSTAGTANTAAALIRGRHVSKSRSATA